MGACPQKMRPRWFKLWSAIIPDSANAGLLSAERRAAVPPAKAVATPETPRPVGCAIYTRKSTEEGLEQEFNSLDAQRECAEAQGEERDIIYYSMVANTNGSLSPWEFVCATSLESSRSAHCPPNRNIRTERLCWLRQSRSIPSSLEVRVFGRENLTASHVGRQGTRRKDLVVRDGHYILRENYKISELAGLD